MRSALAVLSISLAFLFVPSSVARTLPVEKPAKLHHSARPHRPLSYLTHRRPILWPPRLPAHYALWVCIHRGEGAWTSNTGNGYYGGLQMRRGWGGVLYAHLLSPLDQTRLAERGYRRSGYSPSWLRGQWPNTVRPCWRYA